MPENRVMRRTAKKAGTWLVFVLLGAVGGFLSVVQPAWGFHEQGVASCGGCHIMHSTADGFEVVLQPGNEALLKGPSPSDVCLLCHAEGPLAVFGVDPLIPPPEKGGGNFVFLLEDNLNDGPDGMAEPIAGEAAGHSIKAPGFGLASDPRLSLSPGGQFPVSELGCTSCHDPHGNTNFRMLNGDGLVQDDLFSFVFPAPEADGIEMGGGSESRTNHTAYRSGMTDWCANCHGRYHQQGSTPSAFEHPSDRALDAETRNHYNFYNGDEDPTGGTPATAYLPEVPFEDRSVTIESTIGPGPSARIMCLSCHRAHASSAPTSGRWDFNVSLLSEDGLQSGSYPIPDPYGGPSQGPLCHKCHLPIPD